MEMNFLFVNLGVRIARTVENLDLVGGACGGSVTCVLEELVLGTSVGEDWSGRGADEVSTVGVMLFSVSTMCAACSVLSDRGCMLSNNT
jgi:hypothetical protein